MPNIGYGSNKKTRHTLPSGARLPICHKQHPLLATLRDCCACPQAICAWFSHVTLQEYPVPSCTLQQLYNFHTEPKLHR